jgi:6-phosphogluconolactonase
MKKKNVWLSLLLILPFAVAAQKEYYLIVGTYTSGKSEGIYVYKFNIQTADAVYMSAVKTSNPSYLAVSPNQKYVYAVNENADSSRFTEQGSVVAYSFDKAKGTLHFINKQLSGGKHPCYVTVDKTGKWVIAGNYSSGSIGVLSAKKDGSLDSASQVIEHSGYSVNSERQEGPHVHSTVFSKDNSWLFVPDLGIDKTMIYSFNNKTGQLKEGTFPFALSEPGAGPRHFEFHPNGQFAYLMEEMTGTVSVFYYLKKDGQLNMIQTISALPPEYTGPVGSADIHVSPDGKFVYASNRGESNTIAILAVNSQTGLLQPVGHQSTLGKKPRNFNFDPSGNFLLVANQDSDEIVIFSRNKTTGFLTDTGKRISVGSPVCLKWIPVK